MEFRNTLNRVSVGSLSEPFEVDLVYLLYLTRFLSNVESFRKNRSMPWLLSE